ncbi:hypothetical protein D0962_37685 [Leptolyngbyaceae cyanobacterium CCMR0082]|uniref:Uncharacterized protein n=1 Tax=Adonisia turfae CCMR0082 TaxID=2304604 RepID=A0A6M0SIR5_9CYAN|nr:hypothetical protein [Adonisia turfae]NEZ68387.1 hypothetical protein [Adonisia turfae CCMR0082]
MGNIAIASIYFDEATDDAAITFVEKSTIGTITPTGMWKSSDDSFYWDALIQWNDGCKDRYIRINPVAEEITGSFSNRENWLYRQHPLIEPVNTLAAKQKKPEITGKIAKPVNYFMFKQKLKYLEHESKIDWSRFPQAKRMEEMIARRAKTPDVLSLAQAIMEIERAWPMNNFSETTAPWHSNQLEELLADLGL